MVKFELSKMHPLSKSLSPSLLWECIKAQIRSLAMSYSKYKSITKKTKKHDLQNKLDNLETLFSTSTDDTYLAEQIIKTKKDLEIFSLSESRGAQIRAGIKFS